MAAKKLASIEDCMAFVRANRKGRAKKEGTRMTQVRVLYALAANPDGMTRAGIAAYAGVGEQVLILSIGPLDPELRAGHDTRLGYKCLLSLGYIAPTITVLDEKIGEQLVYILTKEGEKEYKRQYRELGETLPEPRKPAPKGKGKGKPKASEVSEDDEEIDEDDVPTPSEQADF